MNELTSDSIQGSEGQGFQGVLQETGPEGPHSHSRCREAPVWSAKTSLVPKGRHKNRLLQKAHDEMLDCLGLAESAEFHCVGPPGLVHGYLGGPVPYGTG